MGVRGKKRKGVGEVPGAWEKEKIPKGAVAAEVS